MHRFVLLYHECPRGYLRPSHWDLMLEVDGCLRTWALACLPRDWQAAHRQSIAVDAHCPPLADENAVATESLADHRLAYLDYEGPLRGERGQVTRVAAGPLRIDSKSPTHWHVTLGGGLAGTVTLERTSPEGSSWTLVYDSG